MSETDKNSAKKCTIPAVKDDTAKKPFDNCCGGCPEARKAAAEGAKPEPHTPCHLRGKDKPKPAAP